MPRRFRLSTEQVASDAIGVAFGRVELKSSGKVSQRGHTCAGCGYVAVCARVGLSGFFATCACTFLLLVAGQGVSWAQVATETIVVTGTRIPTEIEQLGGVATVITARDIRLRQYRSLSEALMGVPGVHVAPSGGTGAQTSVFLRGAESNHVLVLIDGIEMADPRSGSFAFEHLQLNDVERIEVLRGPYSAQYGSEAIGGVINIVTRRGTGAASATARLESGSFATHSGAVHFSGRSGRADFSIGSAWLQTDGQSFTPRRLRDGDTAERDGYDNLDVKIAAGFDFDASSRVDFRFGYVAADTEYDGFVAPFESGALKNSTYLRRYSLAWSGDYLRSFWQPSLQGTYYSSQSDGTAENKTHSDRSKVEWRNDFSFSDSLKLLAGVETELEEISSLGKSGARTRAVYLQAWFSPSERLFLSGGWRNDDPDDFGSDRNWQLSARYLPGVFGTSLYASYGTAFKAPTLGDRFGLFGNPGLDPENAHSLEVGVEQNFKARSRTLDAGWGATWFGSEIQDLIAFDLARLSLENIASAEIEGLELFAFLNTVAGIGLRADATLLRAYDGDRRRLLRRPLRQGALEVRWLGTPNWALSAKLDYVGPQRDVRRDDFVRVTRGGYTLLHVSGRRRIDADLTFFARVNNLLDRGYEPVDGYAGRGIEVHAGLDFNW